MDNLVWRFRARVVACFGLILSIISVVCVVLLTIGALVALSQLINNAAVWGAFIYVVGMDLLAGVQLWVALKLLSATEVGKAADEALQKSRIWLNVNILLLIISTVLNVFSIYFANGAEHTIILIVGCILGYAIYLIMMFIVFKFVQELEIIVNASGSAANNLDIIYVK